MYDLQIILWQYSHGLTSVFQSIILQREGKLKIFLLIFTNLMGICQSRTSKSSKNIQSLNSDNNLKTLESAAFESRRALSLTPVDFQPILIPMSQHYIEHQKPKYGKQYEVIHRDSQKGFTVGVIEKPQLPVENTKLLQQFSMWISMNHPNIQKCQDVYESNNTYFIVKEQIKGVPLFDYLQAKKLSEVKFRHLIQKIMEAVNQLHLKGIVHDDLRSDNIILENYEKDAQLKIQTIQEFKRSGTEHCRSPESLRGQPNTKSDVWSIGVLIYFGLCGEMPFDGKDSERLRANIHKGILQFDGYQWESISDESIALIKKMLCYSHFKRPTLQLCMLDPWFSKPKMKLSKKQKSRIQDASERMLQFNCRFKIQQATMLLIIDKFGSEKDTKKLLSLFRKLDTDHSGTLSKPELIEGYSQIMSREEAIKEVDQVFKSFDIDDSGLVDYNGKTQVNEFLLSQCMKSKHLTKDRIIAVFNEIDLDKNGTLNYQEVKRLLLRLSMNDDEIQKAIAEFDKDKNGEISKDEFVEGMLDIKKREETKKKSLIVIQEKERPSKSPRGGSMIKQ